MALLRCAMPSLNLSCKQGCADDCLDSVNPCQLQQQVQPYFVSRAGNGNVVQCAFFSIQVFL